MRYGLYGVGVAVAAAAAIAGSPALAQNEAHPFHGFYVGANAGIGWGDTNSHLHLETGAGSPIPPADVVGVNSLVSSGHHNHSGFAGGIEGGYNFVTGGGATNDYFFGVETDFGFLDLKQTKDSTYQSALLISPPINYSLHQKVHTDWMWTLRPRVGYITGPWMFFGSAGLAISDIKIETSYHDNLTPPGSASFSHSSTKVGFAGGLGVGYAFSPQWSVKGEWLYTDLGKVSASTASPSENAVITADAKMKANLIRFGIDYAF
jgi:outer membrane immunogenic protein